MSQEVQDKPKVWYFQNGFNLSQCRKLCKFVFGDFYDKVERDVKNQIFHIYLYESRTDLDGKTKLRIQDYSDVEYFRKFWCANGMWQIHFISETKVF